MHNSELSISIMAHVAQHLTGKAMAAPMQVAAGKRTQLELEDSILHLLATATGSMLDNVELIETLDQSKTTWEVVNESLRVAEETAHQIEAASAQYRPCSVRAALLYFVLNDLAGRLTAWCSRISLFHVDSQECLQAYTQGSLYCNTWLPSMMSSTTSTVISGALGDELGLSIFMQASIQCTSSALMPTTACSC